MLYIHVLDMYEVYEINKKYFYVFLVDLKKTINNNNIYSFIYW